MLKRKQKIKLSLVHILSWCLVISMPLLDVLDPEIDFSVAEFLSEYLTYVFFFYLNYFVLIPRFVYKKKYVQYVLVSEAIVLTVITFYFLSGVIQLDEDEEGPVPFVLYVVLSFVIQVPIVLLFIVSFFARYYLDWYRVTLQKKHIEIEQLQSQLKYLKMQVQPHFLFNSLNNLYALCIAKDDSAPLMVSKLSRLMRYMLYETESKTIPLHKELRMMEDFVELQLLKKPVSEQIDFYQEGIEQQHKIAPLLLLNFMENAFKHSNIFTDSEAYIEMSCTVTDMELVFESVNSVGEGNQVQEISGIGNVNVQEQLDILYPGRYQLEKVHGAEEYRVRLTIDMNETPLKIKS